MEQVLLQLQTLSRSDTLPTKLKKGAQEAAVALLDGLTLVMASTEYIKGISSLLKHSDTSIRRKVSVVAGEMCDLVHCVMCALQISWTVVPLEFNL